MRVVIIGNGIAGNETAFTLRELDNDIEIIIISAENYPEYDRCSLPYFVGGDVSREAVFRKKVTDYKDKNIQLILNDKARVIEPAAKVVVTEGGGKYSYDKLVLAYGVHPFIPAVKGIDKAGVFGFKQLNDADMLSGQGGGATVVIGSGAIGIEVAEALKKRGCQVTVIELLDWVLPNLFDEPLARRLEDSLRGCGIHVLTGEKVQNILGEAQVTGVETDKRQIPAERVIVAAGLVPENAMAEAAGIELGRGIKVNRKMETNIPDIYACGDCAETADFSTGESCMYPFKHNALEQARFVARSILGQEIKYPGAYVFARIHFFDTYAATFGKTLRNMPLLKDVEIIERESHDGYLRVLVKSGEIAGAQAIGKFAHYIGLLLGTWWRHDNIDELRRDWEKIARLGSPYPRTLRQIGFLLGKKLMGNLGNYTNCLTCRDTQGKIYEV